MGRYLIFIIPVVALACLHPRVFSHVSERLLKRFGTDTLPSTLPFGTVLRLGGVYAISFIIAADPSLAMPTSVTIATAIAVRLAQTASELLYAGGSVLYARRLPELKDARKADVSASESVVPIS